MGSSLNEKLSLLPDDIRELVQGMDAAQAEQLMGKLIQATELSFRVLQEADIDLIKSRTAENSAFGFLSADVDITWQELQKPGYIALGAFDEQEEGGPEVPVAFVIAEVSRLEEMQEFYWELEDTPLPPPNSTDPSSSSGQHEPSLTSTASASAGAQDNGSSGSSAVPPSPSSSSPAAARSHQAPGQGEGREMQQLLRRAGWSGSDTIVSVFYIGVDFEYRRQGIGKQLLDLVKEVGEAARARLMWLTVAEWNPNALSFYTKYGFNTTQEVKKGKRGNHLLLVYPLSQAKPASGPSRSGKGKSKKKGGKDRGFGAVAQAADAGGMTRAPAPTEGPVRGRVYAGSCVAGVRPRALQSAGAGHARRASMLRQVAQGRSLAGGSRVM